MVLVKVLCIWVLVWAYGETVATFGNSTSWRRTLRRARWGV